jgi:hypothetical protein
MKTFVPWLALLVLSLGFSVSVGLAGSATLHGPAPVAGALRCVKDRISVEGVTDERAILFVQDGFSCKPA